MRASNASRYLQWCGWPISRVAGCVMHTSTSNGLINLAFNPTRRFALAGFRANYLPKGRLQMATGLLAQLKAMFDGDPGVRKVADDPLLSAELLLLFRMILADGQVLASEMEVFRRICRDAFGIAEESIDGVIEYLNDFGYETSGQHALALFQDMDLERRQLLARHMADIAKADSQLAENEVRLLRRTLDMLGISPVDVVKPAD